MSCSPGLEGLNLVFILSAELLNKTRNQSSNALGFYKKSCACCLVPWEPSVAVWDGSVLGIAGRADARASTGDPAQWPGR